MKYELLIAVAVKFTWILIIASRLQFDKVKQKE